MSSPSPSTPPDSPPAFNTAFQGELPVTPLRRYKDIPAAHLLFTDDDDDDDDDNDTPRAKMLGLRASLLVVDDPQTPSPVGRSSTRYRKKADDATAQPTLDPSPNADIDCGDVPCDDNSTHSANDWVSPLPLVAPSSESVRIHSLHDLLRVTLPENPPPYRNSALKGMKTITKNELAISHVAQLKKVVYVEDLVTQLRDQAEKQLRNLKLDGNVLDPDVFCICQIHPYLTGKNLPRKIHSEKDTEDWCNAVLFRPALAALRCVIAKKIIHNFEGEFPYISSAPGREVIPDGILVEERTVPIQESGSSFWNIQDGKVILTIEVKTQPAWEKMDFHELQTRPVYLERGTAMRFVWPTEDDKNPDEQTRLLVQAWTHMVKSVHGIEILSTLHLTTFLVRGRNEDNSDTLYISPSYDRESCPIYAVYCWFALARGIISFESLNLPAPITAQWPKSAHDEYHETCGILAATRYDRCGPPVTPTIARGVATRSQGPAVFGAL
ncbi:predicted protein [Sparassis crispa]|uniref:Uncharacterized protein n=1 Tax=Sparassis crispa TaxID=139825 RepID=A0A401H3W2_9APHY|nr:predicted protein [Sparassis crispa]GBE89104.1 predicted protein [Sparassis crispa]